MSPILASRYWPAVARQPKPYLMLSTKPIAEASSRYRVGHLTSARCGSWVPCDRRSAYAEPMAYTRITVNPDQMGGVACLRGLRIPVATVVAMVADGMTTEEILTELPDLEADDIPEALRFAADAVRERQLPLLNTA